MAVGPRLPGTSPETDEPLPCDPEEFTAVLGYLCALVPEYELARQADALNDEERRAVRWLPAHARSDASQWQRQRQTQAAAILTAGRVILAGKPLHPPEAA